MDSLAHICVFVYIGGLLIRLSMRRMPCSLLGEVDKSVAVIIFSLL